VERDLPPAGEARWGVVPQAAVRGGENHPRVPPSNLGATASAQGPLGPFPPLGGGKESVHTAVDHNEESSF